MRNQPIRPLAALLAIFSVILVFGLAMSWANPARATDSRDHVALDKAPLKIASSE